VAKRVSSIKAGKTLVSNNQRSSRDLEYCLQRDTYRLRYSRQLMSLYKGLQIKTIAEREMTTSRSACKYSFICNADSYLASDGD